MADFPSLLAWKGSKQRGNDPLLAERSRSGAFKARRLQSGAKQEFELIFKRLTAAQKTTLVTFYNANRVGTFNFLWSDGVTYVVAFADPERSLEWEVSDIGDRWDTEVKLAEV